MRVIFAGTPEFARVALASLHEAGFDIPLILTQPDRPAGRGMKLQASAVKQWAEKHAIPVAQPRSLRLDGKYPDDAAAARDAIAAARADAMVVAAYGLILPQWTLDAARLGAFNIHGSLLPRWRGAAPIHRAIEAGDAETGITIMQMDAGLDTGDMLAVQKVAIGPAATTAILHDELAALGGRMIVETLRSAGAGSLAPVRQPADGVTYANKIDKAESAIDWSRPASAIDRQVRAFDPFPAASSSLGGETLKLWRAAVLPGVAAPPSARPGEVLAAGADGIDICTADGVLRVSRLQKAGGKPLDAADFLRGFGITPGMCFGSDNH